MGKFCSYCGKPLPENGVCDCPEAQAAAAAQRPASQPITENVYVKKTREAVGQSVPFVKNNWKDPMAATRTALQEKNMGLAVVMMVLNMVVTGLLLFCTFHKLGSELRSAMRGAMGRIDVEVPFFSCFLLGAVIGLVALALSAVVIFAILKMSHIDASFQYVIIAVGTNSVLCTASLVLALLMVLLGWTTGVALFLLLGMVAWVVLGVLLLVKVFGVSISGVMQTVTCVLFAAVLVLNVWIGSKLALSAAKGIEIDGDKIGDMIEDLEDELGDLEDMDLSDIILNGF